jgi:hypothetical protein
MTEKKDKFISDELQKTNVYSNNTVYELIDIVKNIDHDNFLSIDKPMLETITYNVQDAMYKEHKKTIIVNTVCCETLDNVKEVLSDNSKEYYIYSLEKKINLYYIRFFSENITRKLVISENSLFKVAVKSIEKEINNKVHNMQICNNEFSRFLVKTVLEYMCKQNEYLSKLENLNILVDDDKNIIDSINVCISSLDNTYSFRITDFPNTLNKL